MKIPKAELIYLAGVFDGEGSISISRRKPCPPRRPSPQYNLHVSFVMTNESMVATFARHFGGKLSPFYKGCGFESRLTCYVWRVADFRATTTLKKLLPYLRVKREQAVLALEFVNGKDASRSTGEVLDNYVVENRHSIYEQMGKLNNSFWYRKRHQGA